MVLGGGEMIASNIDTHNGLCPTRRSWMVCPDKRVYSAKDAAGSGGK